MDSTLVFNFGIGIVIILFVFFVLLYERGIAIFYADNSFKVSFNLNFLNCNDAINAAPAPSTILAKANMQT